MFDAGELAAAAWELGGSHPPGQPVHALVTHALCRLLPLGPLAARMSLVSALGAVVAADQAGRFAAQLCRNDPTATVHTRLARSAATVGVGLCPIVLRQSLRIEVYTLALAISLGALLQLLRWSHSGRKGPLLGATVLAGVAAAVHPPHALGCAGFGAVLALVLRRQVLRRPLSIVAGGLLAAATASALYAYLPLRALAGAAMWGTPTTWPGLLAYLRGDIFAHNLGAGGGSYWAQLADFLGHLSVATGVVPWVGVALLWRRSPRLGSALGLGIIALCAAAALQPLDVVNPDNVAYLGPAAALLIATGSAGLALGFGSLPQRRPGWLVPGATGAVLLLLALQPGHLPWLPARLQSDLPAFETWTGMLVEDPPPRALLVVTQDAAAASVMLAQQLDGARPDLVLFIPGLATNRFHWRSLGHHPLFDGRPVLGPGPDRRTQLAAGAAARAQGQVAIFHEREAAGFQTAALTGAYLVNADSSQTVLGGGLGERLTYALARDQLNMPMQRDGASTQRPGQDWLLAAGVMRDHQLTRARRLLARRAARPGLRALAFAVPELTPTEQAALLALSGVPERPFPGYIDRPDVPFATRGDAERAVAAHAWALGAPGLATTLLTAQAARGDARAYLQQALLQLAAGHPKSAQTTLRRALASAPELTREARPLAAAVAAAAR